MQEFATECRISVQILLFVREIIICRNICPAVEISSAGRIFVQRILFVREVIILAENIYLSSASVLEFARVMWSCRFGL